VKGEDSFGILEVEAIGGRGNGSRSGEAPAEKDVEREREDVRRETRGGEREPIRTSPEKGQPSVSTGSTGDRVRRRLGEAGISRKYFDDVVALAEACSFSSSDAESRTKTS